MKKSKNKLFIVFIIVFSVVFFFCLYFSLNDGISISFGVIKDIIYKPFTDINNKEDLIGKNLNYEILDENEKLKSIANIDKTLSSFKSINATVIERNQAYWLESITINKGKKDGVDIGMAVVVSEGLIGKVTNITKNTSTVKLITSNDNNNKISIKIKNGESYIYKVLETSKDKLIIKGIDNSIKSLDNASVLTSGLSDIYPSGILIGNIIRLSSDKYGTSKTAFVNSEVDFKNIRFVSVLSRE